MQRDAYAALVKKRHKKKIPMRIRQITGEVFNELIFDEVFIGYRNRRLVLLTYMAGTNPRHGPRLKHDVIIPDFAKLQRVHQPHFVYQLVPLMCSNLETFKVLQAVCNSKGSPFCMEDRHDTYGLTMRFGIASAHREMIKAEMLQCPLLSAAQLSAIRMGTFPINGVEFDGALVKRGKVFSSNHSDEGGVSTTTTKAEGDGGPTTVRAGSDISPDSSPHGSSLTTSKSSSSVGFVSSTALITRVDYLTEAEIQKRLIMMYFFHSGTYWRLGCNSTLFNLVRETRERLHIIGVSNPVLQGRSDLLGRARQAGLHIYEKVSEELYQYAQP